MSNMYEEEYELWLDKDLYFTDFVEPQEDVDSEIIVVIDEDGNYLYER